MDYGAIITALLPFIVPIIVAVVKKVTEAMPKWLLPIIAAIIGAILEVINQGALGEASVTIGTVGAGSILGLAGVGIREVFKKWTNQVLTKVEVPNTPK